jgi:hypothetical protein
MLGIIFALWASKKSSLFRFRYKGGGRQSMVRPHVDRGLNDLEFVWRPIESIEALREALRKTHFEEQFVTSKTCLNIFALSAVQNPGLG